MKAAKLIFSVFLLFSFTTFLTSEEISFKSDKMSGTAGNKNDTTTLSGNAFVKTDSMEISASEITLSGTDFRYIKAEGKVSAKNHEKKMEFSCEKLSYDRESKIASLEGEVHLEDTQNEVSAKAQIIEYDEISETAILQINIELKQKDNVCTGTYAIYHKDEQRLELSGSPKIVQGKDTFKAQQITLDLNTQEITLSGRVQGSVSSSSRSREKQQAMEKEKDGSI